jgi:polysaccharide deacetylase family protein (PEP-CTERM system associated)
MGRHLGTPEWDRPGPAFERQVRRVFDLLDGLGARATFFLLGASMRHYPEIVQELVRRGDEIACHGYAHELVYTQSRTEFRRDLERAVDLTVKLTGARPRGFRAPAFSINRRSLWAFEELADLGFEYDTSQYDSPRIPDRVRSIPGAPYRMALPSGKSLLEFPLAVARVRRVGIPVGGGSYWRVFPSAILRRGLSQVEARAGYSSVYFHPYEVDSEALRAPRSGSTARQRLRASYYDLRYLFGRRRVLDRLRTVAREFRIKTYHEAFTELSTAHDTRTRSLSQSGVVV